ncbi:MAG: hypothetical protein Ct9H300mP13_3240 [Gammaproteobacteria bacterium]|nr:MAG: hypothetical protein Ct9H300mP13_3240 [Gammaproteobacteria bacterium]
MSQNKHANESKKRSSDSTTCQQSGWCAVVSAQRNSAIIVPTLEQPIFADTVDGAESELNARNLQVLVGQTKYDMEREAELVKPFLKLRPEGLILTGSNHLPSYTTYSKQPIYR